MVKRLEFIDIAKGIGILLVVMGHNDFGAVSPFFYKFIYAFHMPLFFFVSGMFFKDDIPFLIMLRRRFDSLIKPYLVTLIMIFFMTISFTKVNFDIATTRIIKAIYANGHYIDWVQLWFIPHLFALNIFAFGYFKFVKIAKSKWATWIFLFLIQTIGVFTLGAFWPFVINIFGRNITIFGLPLSIDIILVSGFFFILGREVNRIVPSEVFAHPLTLLVSVSALMIMLIFLPQTIDFNTRVFESLPINSLESILGIIFILSLSKKIENIPFLSRIFRYVGQASLIILIFHVPIQETWGEKLFYYFNNQKLSYWISYFAGVGFPILINYYVIQPNPFLRNWFGQEKNKNLINTYQAVSTENSSS